MAKLEADRRPNPLGSGASDMSRETRDTGFPLPGLTTVLLALAAAFVGWVIWQAAETDRHVEDRKEAAEQRKAALVDPEASSRERVRAIDAWADEGSAAVPQLLGELDNPTPEARAAVALALGRIRPPQPEVVGPLVERLEDADAQVRDAAGGSLSHFSGLDASVLAPYLPRLARLLDGSDKQMRNDILTILGRSEIGRDTYAEVLRLTQSAQPEVRRVAAAIIRELDRIDANSIAAVRPLLDDADAAVRGEAFRTLAAFGAVTVDESLGSLNSEDDSVRSLACVALQTFGSDASRATDRLRELLRSDRDRELALETLGSIGLAAEAAVPDVLELHTGAAELEATHAQEYVRGLRRAVAARCLARISTDDVLVLGILEQDLFSRNQWASQFAGETLREFDPERAQELVPELVAKLPDADAEQTGAVLAALGGIGPDAAGAVPTLVELLEADSPGEIDPESRSSAIGVLRRIGPPAAEAVPALAARLRMHLTAVMTHDRQSQSFDEASREITALLRALHYIGARSPEAERILIEFIEAELPRMDQHVTDLARRSWFDLAVLALGRVGAGSEAAYGTICSVQQACEQRPPNPTVYGPPLLPWDPRVLWALGDVGVRPVKTVDVLLRAIDDLRSEREDGRADLWAVSLGTTDDFGPGRIDELVAIRGLGMFPECSEQSVPALAKALEDEDHAIRVAAVLSLRNLGKAARAAQPQLRRIDEDPANHVAPVLRYAARSGFVPRTPLDVDPPPDPLWDYPSQFRTVSIGEAARDVLEQIGAATTDAGN